MTGVDDIRSADLEHRDAGFDRDTGLDRRSFVRAAGAVGLAGVLASVGVNDAAAALKRPTAPKASTKPKLIWASHFFAGVPVAAEVAVGFRDFLDPVGWDFQILAAKTPGDVKQTLAALQQALTLKPNAIVATMNDPKAFTNTLRKIRDSGIPLFLNNAQPPGGNGLGLSYVGPNFESAGAGTADAVCAAALKNGHKSGVILIGHCCPGSAAPDGFVTGGKAGIKAFNAKNNTSFKFADFIGRDEVSEATAVAAWKVQYRKAGDNAVGTFHTGIGNPDLLAQQALKIPPGKIPIGHFNPDPINLKGMEDGYYASIADQQLYSQGYVSAAQAWQQIVAGFRPVPDYSTYAGITKADLNVVRTRQARIQKRAKALGYG